MKRRYVILIIIVAAVLVAFPTPHDQTNEVSIVDKTLDCTALIDDRKSLVFGLTDMPSYVNVDLAFSSKDNTLVEIIGNQYWCLENRIAHFYRIIVNEPTFSITITNPYSYDISTDGYIRVYKNETETYTAWLPWWMP